MILPKKNDDFIKGLIKQGEGENLEFKTAITNPQKLAKALAAFANTSGGFVLVGINDQKKIIGIDPEEEIHMVEHANATFLSPALTFHYEVFEISADFGESEEDVSLLLVKVEKSKNQCLFRMPDESMAYYSRVGARNVQLVNP